MKKLLTWLLSASFAYAAGPDPSKVDEIFAPFSGSSSPGCELGVLREGEFVYKKAYGLSDLERHTPLTTASPIYVGSAAKQFTAAVIAQLVRKGRISLDDAVRKHIPELPAYAGAITVRHLIHHTSGVRDYLALMAMAGEPDEFNLTESRFLALLSRQKRLNFEPGTEHLYSNSGYVLLSILVRRVTGKSLRATADELLFEPLGMRRTHFVDDPRDLNQDRALGYSPKGTGHVLNTSAVVGITGDGGLFTTVDDLRAWDRYLSSTEGQDLLVRGQLKDGTELDYAFGLVHVKSFGYPLIAHGGSFRGYRAGFAKYPDQKLTVICLCNNAGAIAPMLGEKVASLYLNAKLPASQPAQPRAQTPPRGPAVGERLPEELTRYLGRYYSEELDAEYEVSLAPGKLGFHCKNSTFEAEAEGKDLFRFSSYSIQFQLNASGQPAGYTMSAPRARHLHFTRQTAP